MCLCVHSVNYTEVVGSILVRQVCVCVWLTGFSWRLCDTLGVSEQQTKALPVVKDDYKRELYTVAHVSSPIQFLRGQFKLGFVSYQADKLSEGRSEPRFKPCLPVENPAWIKTSGTASDWILSPLIINPHIHYGWTSAHFIPMHEAQGAFSGENHVCTDVWKRRYHFSEQVET